MRIRSIMGYLTKCLQKYQPYINDEEKRKECVDHLLAIIPHHCGNHDLCLDCNLRIIQQENPTEPDSTHKYLYAQSSRYGGQNMSLTNDGIETLTKVIMKRFNEKSLDKLEMLPCVNDCERFFGLTKIFQRKKKMLKPHRLVELL